MGQLNFAEINPTAAVVNGVKTICHDCSVFVRNEVKSECNCCGCLVFGFQTFETHESDSSESSWSSDHMKSALCCGE